MVNYTNMKALIAITTCNRIDEVKKNIIPYLQFCNNRIGFDFVLSLDGCDSSYFDFCKKYMIPLIWSNQREGVGISKNRVLKTFPNYDFYFFIEDDVELYNSNIFDLLIEVSRITNYQNFSPNHTIGILKKEKFFNNTLIHTCFGGGYFLFYTNKCIKAIGGWHDAFAKYKRYGHTEHTYRAYYSKLNPSPFIFIKEAQKMIIVHSPPHVTKLKKTVNKNGLINEEQAMIDNRQSFYPIKTISNYYVNNEDVTIKNLHKDLSENRYFLITKKQKRQAKSAFCFHKFKLSKNPIFLILTYIYNPRNKFFNNYLVIKWRTWKLNLS